MEEIKDVIDHMPHNKALGLDGFPAKFFTFCWDIVGQDFVNVIQFFFLY
jgi:hypothetical protein